MTLCLLSLSALCAADPALEAPPVNLDPGPAYADDARRWQGIPGLERAANGRLWAVWYSGGQGEGPDNYVILVTSADDGATWSGPRLVIDPPGRVRAYDPMLWHDPEGRLWLCWAQSYGWWDGRSGTWAIRCDNSGDERPTWTAPRRLCDGITMNKPTVLGDGRWLLPAAIWERAADPQAGEFAHDLGEAKGGNLHVSTDRGDTWALLGRTRVPRRVFDEHMVVERRDGSLWCLVRTDYGVGESISTDGGRTWSSGGPSTLRNANSRFHLRRLRSGHLLLLHHDPPDTAKVPGRSHLTARLSADDGATWSAGLLLDERSGVSYPDAVEAPDGRLYCIYDHSRTGAREILLATFTEADILAGQDVSGHLRRRVPVNRASGPK